MLAPLEHSVILALLDLALPPFQEKSYHFVPLNMFLFHFWKSVIYRDRMMNMHSPLSLE